MDLGFIRYFCTTDDSGVGTAARHYLMSLLRIAPVRIVSKSGQLEGMWRRYSSLLLTPMGGACVSCVCTPPGQWIWEARVPMPSRDVGAAHAAAEPPDVNEIANGRMELYTPPAKNLVRNVLFIASAPVTDVERETMAKYESVVVENLDIAAAISDRWPARAFQAPVIYTPVSETQHHAVREAVLGSFGTINPYR